MLKSLNIYILIIILQIKILQYAVKKIKNVISICNAG